MQSMRNTTGNSNGCGTGKKVGLDAVLGWKAARQNCILFLPRATSRLDTRPDSRRDPMPRQPFAALPDSARLWVFAAARPLAAAERDALLAAVDAFLDEWNAHRVPLDCARDLRYDQFLLVGRRPGGRRRLGMLGGQPGPDDEGARPAARRRTRRSRLGLLSGRRAACTRVSRDDFAEAADARRRHARRRPSSTTRCRRRAPCAPARGRPRRPAPGTPRLLLA